MRHVWIVWLRYVLVGLVSATLMVAISGCSGFGCGCDNEDEEARQALLHGTLVSIDPGDIHETDTTIPASSSGTTVTCPDTGEPISNGTSPGQGFSVPNGTVPPLPSVSDNPGVDMITNWKYFFYGPTPVSTKVQLLENGQQHVGELTDFAATPFAAGLHADVTKSSWTSGETTGQVIYDLFMDGTTLVTGGTGTMILEDKVWKVSEQSFQELLTLQQESSALSTKTP